MVQSGCAYKYDTLPAFAAFNLYSNGRDGDSPVGINGNFVQAEMQRRIYSEEFVHFLYRGFQILEGAGVTN